MSQVFQYHLNLRGQSGRVVRFRILGADEIDKIEANGARAAGEDADFDALRREQLRQLTAAFIVAYTEPNQAPAMLKRLKRWVRPKQDPALHKADDYELVIDGGVADAEKLAGAKWIEANTTEFHTFGLGKVFTAKDISALRFLYNENHVINAAEVEMLTGKAIPVATEG